MGAHRSARTESAYVIRGDVAPDTIARSLQTLLPTRRRPIAKHRFTVRGQADVEEYGSLLEILDEQGKTVARLRIASGRARLPVGRDPRLVHQVGPLADRLTALSSRLASASRRGEGGSGPASPARSSDHSWQPLPTVMTLTGLRGYEDAYRQLIPVIESRPGIERCPDGFHGVMLRQVGIPDAANLPTSLVDLEPTVRADVGARRIQRALFDSLVANEPGVRANLDTEFLHDFRVAVRRTRALLRQMKNVFPPDAVEHFSTEFSWLGRLTGGPRDLDVLVLTLRERQLTAPDDAMEALTSLLVQLQQQEHQALVAALDNDRHKRLLLEWPAFLERSTVTEPEPRNAKRPLADVVAERAWRLYRRISRAADRFDDQTTPEQLHEMRIDAKKLRYLIDVTPGFYPTDDLSCVLGALKSLQRVLGDFNDSYVQQQRLVEYGGAGGPASGCERAVLAISRLAEERTEHRERLRQKVVKALAGFQSRETRGACRRAFEQSDQKER